MHLRVRATFVTTSVSLTMSETDINVCLMHSEREFIVRTQGGRMSAKQIGLMFQVHTTD